MATQWHPLFAQLLRPLLEGFYEVLTNVPVGDMPREADVALLRRTTTQALPFQGMWRHLTIWNVLEYKGPSVSARVQDIDLLIELGLGVHRRLNQERVKAKLPEVAAADVSFWYLAGKLGRRFRAAAEQRLGRPWHLVGAGIWSAATLERPMFFVSAAELPVEPESVPLHLLGKETLDREPELAKLVIERPSLWDIYGSFLGSLHSSILMELKAMGKTASKGPRFQLKPLVDFIGLKEVVEQIGARRVIEEVGMKRVVDALGVRKVIDEVGLKQVIDEVGLKQVIDEVGLKQVIDEVGLKQVIDEVGLKQVIGEVGLDRVLAEVGKKKVLSHLLEILTPAERAALKRQLDNGH